MFGKWSALDIVVSIIVGSNLSRVLTGSAPLWGTLAATGLLMALHWVLAHASAPWPAVSHVLEGRAIALAEANRLDEARRKQNAVSEADLNEALRQSALSNLEQVERVTLEPSRRITVERTHYRAEARPMTT